MAVPDRMDEQLRAPALVEAQRMAQALSAEGAQRCAVERAFALLHRLRRPRIRRETATTRTKLSSVSDARSPAQGGSRHRVRSSGGHAALSRRWTGFANPIDNR
ncbi:hypothetical protein GCM10010211_55280 [Streptomyces albospinus]|uniref:Transposase n=1 Tax=Streptomyces albospinus TaxID=285515 RepID=A0ABQ2VEI8_9ACTN|nr:hypothetical protein GCM10010211_55280 [Streptomyces albospinus]